MPIGSDRSIRTLYGRALPELSNTCLIARAAAAPVPNRISSPPPQVRVHCPVPPHKTERPYLFQCPFGPRRYGEAALLDRKGARLMGLAALIGRFHSGRAIPPREPLHRASPGALLARPVRCHRNAPSGIAPSRSIILTREPPNAGSAQGGACQPGTCPGPSEIQAPKRARSWLPNPVGSELLQRENRGFVPLASFAEPNRGCKLNVIIRAAQGP